MSENIRFAYQSIKSHKMRSFLTMLGVIIGIASIIAIVSTIKGTNELIMEKMIGAGNNNVTISLRQGDEQYYLDMGAPKGVHPVTDKQKEEIRELDHVQDATFYQYRDYTSDIRAGSSALDSARILGIDPHFLNTRGYEVCDGNPFRGTDYKRIRKAALLDEAAIIIDAYNAEAAADAKQVVSCRIVRRAMGAGSSAVPIGATQGTMTAGPYTQSWTMGNGSTGELYLGRTEKKLLGISNQIGCSNPYAEVVS
jgi:putative ABC transport system permease protein